MNGFGVFLRKELREAVSSNRLLVVGIIFALLGIISPLGAKYTPELLKALGNGVQITLPEPTVKDALAQFLKNVGGNGIFIAILLAMGVVAREKERGTTAFVLAKPLTRQAFLTAKLIGLLVTLGIGVVLAGAAAYFYTALLFAPTSLPGFVGCCLLILLSLLVYASVTFLGSTLASSSLPAAGIGIVAWVLFAILGAFPQVEQYTPSGLLESAGALALGTEPVHLAVSLLANIAIIGAALALAWLAFRAQEQVAVA